MGKNNESNLVQYILIDGSQIITNSRNKVLEVSKDGISYLPMKSLFGRYIAGSVDQSSSMRVGEGKFSKQPKEGQNLVTTRILGLAPEIGIYSVKKINKNFCKK